MAIHAHLLRNIIARVAPIRLRGGLFIGFLSAACSKSPPHEAADRTKEDVAENTSAAAVSEQNEGADAKPNELRSAAPRWLKSAATADIDELVAQVQSQLKASETLLVYVGATWCEPCTRFHDAALNGELEEVLQHVVILEFDYDHSKDALADAGYRSPLIPLFVRPNRDGTASSNRIFGGVKGERAVEDLRRRLAPILKNEVPNGPAASELRR